MEGKVDLFWYVISMTIVVILSVFYLIFGNVGKFIETKYGNIFLMVVGIFLVSFLYVLISLAPASFVIETKTLPTFLGTMGDFMSPFAILVTFYVFVAEKHQNEQTESRGYYIERVRKCFVDIHERITAISDIVVVDLGNDKFF